MNEYYTPTKEEIDAIEHVALITAWKTLQPIKDNAMAVSDMLLYILQAIQDINEVADKANVDLLIKHPESKYLMFNLRLGQRYPDVTYIIISALLNLDIECQDDICQKPAEASRIAALLKVAGAMDAMKTIASAFNGDYRLLSAYLVDETLKLAEASIKGHVKFSSLVNDRLNLKTPD